VGKLKTSVNALGSNHISGPCAAPAAKQGRRQAAVRLALVASLLLFPARHLRAETPTNSQPRVRPPAVAGLFYPAEKQVLSKTIDELLAGAPAHHIPRLKG
jgi:hypothetical protein